LFSRPTLSNADRHAARGSALTSDPFLSRHFSAEHSSELSFEGSSVQHFSNRLHIWAALVNLSSVQPDLRPQLSPLFFNLVQSVRGGHCSGLYKSLWCGSPFYRPLSTGLHEFYL